MRASSSASAIVSSSPSPVEANNSSTSLAAPPPRRRGLSGLRRRLSQTFRLSFHGSLSELSTPAFTIEEVSRDDELAAEFGGDDFDDVAGGGGGAGAANARGRRRMHDKVKTNKEPTRRGKISSAFFSFQIGITGTYQYWHAMHAGVQCACIEAHVTMGLDSRPLVTAKILFFSRFFVDTVQIPVHLQPHPKAQRVQLQVVGRLPDHEERQR